MKKLAVFLLVAALCIGLCPGVFAQSEIQSLDSRAMVNSNGSCTVDLTVTLSLDEAVEPVFPIPAVATDITLNAQKAHTTTSGQYKLLSLHSREIAALHVMEG